MNKNIFTYERNGEKVHADPIILYRRLYQVCQTAQQQFHKLYALAFPQVAEGEPDPVAETAGPREQLYPFICATFGLPIFDAKSGEGTLIEEAETILLNFMDFLSKKNPTPAN